MLHLYVSNPDEYRYFNRNFCLNGKLSVKSYTDAFVLPLKFMEEPKPWGKLKGGVVDSGKNFVAGLTRNIKEETFCLSAYEFNEKETEYQDETIYFGGIILPYFGHVLLETLSRLWGVVSVCNNIKIAFLLEKENTTIPEYFWSFMELLNIDRKRIVIIRKITKFKEILVPDESFMFYNGFYQEYNYVLNQIKKNLSDTPYKKIYLTRRKFKNDALNEAYFEKFYARQGFSVLAIEELPLKEQLSIWHSVEEVVCVAGTLPHLILFSKPGTKLTILNRTESVIGLQAFINQIAKPECTFVDVYNNFLPTDHNCFSFLLGPNVFWKRYLTDSRWKYNSKDFYFDIAKFFYEYLEGWLKYYSDERFKGQLKSKTGLVFLDKIQNFLNSKIQVAEKSYYIVSGGFDPIHEGHIEMIKASAAESDGVIVLANSDAWLCRKKGKNFHSMKTRKAILENLKGVIDVLEFNDDDNSASDGIRKVRAKYPEAHLVFANGGDRGKDNIPEIPVCKECHVDLAFGVGGENKANSSSWILERWHALEAKNLVE